MRLVNRLFRNAAVSAWFVLAACFPLTGESLAELLASASSVNPIVRSAAVTLEIAKLEYERDRITAADERGRLRAEMNLLSAHAAYRTSLRSYYNEVIDAIFDAARAELDRRIASLEADTAAENERATEASYLRGLSSEESLENARLALRTAALGLEQAEWEFREYDEALKASTGLAWSETLPPSSVPEFAVALSPEDWIENDPAVRRARISERIAEISLELMPLNATRFDRLLAETELERARLAVRQAEAAALGSYRSLLQRGRSQYATLRIRREQTEIQERLAEGAIQRYLRGLISNVERDQDRVRALNARRSYYEAMRSYLKTYLEYLVAVGRSPEEQS